MLEGEATRPRSFAAQLVAALVLNRVDEAFLCRRVGQRHPGRGREVGVEKSGSEAKEVPAIVPAVPRADFADLLKPCVWFGDDPPVVRRLDVLQ
jgi:hypothetical protein